MDGNLRSIVLATGLWVASAPLWASVVSSGATSPPAFPAQAAVLTEALARLGLSAPPVVFRAGTPPDGASFTLDVDASGRVEVLAADAAGAARAAATLLREARGVGGAASWPAGRRSDGPDLPYRSFMVDMARNPHDPATLRRVVDMLWFHRANVLHLHLTDDQLFAWPSAAFPALQSASVPWTLDDFVALESYARARGVVVMPEVDVPGHSTILRREYPEVFGGTPTELARLPSAQAGLETLLDEMLAVFTSTPYVHVGGDEAYGVPETLQRDLINRLDDFVRSRGRRTVVWEGPRLGTGADKVHAGVLHMNWNTVNVPAQAMLDAGYEVVNAAWDPMYVVDHYPRTMFTAVDVERCFAWDPRRFGHVDGGLATFAEPHVTDTAEGILGFCMPWWEGRQEHLFDLCLPRFAALAEAAWDLERPGGYPGFQAQQARLRPRLLALAGIELAPLPLGDAAAEAHNLAFGRPVSVSWGADQPPFGPQRLTNGVREPLDHFLGFPTRPEPLVITIALDSVQRVDRVVVHETARGESFEQYRLLVSADGERFEAVGLAERGTRGERPFVEHRFAARPVGWVRIETDGCQQLTFPTFSRLCEVSVHAAE